MYQEILNDRRSGKSKGIHSDGSEDLLSILMSFEFYNGKDNEMLDELGTFFFAGMKTVQMSTANTLMFLAQNPDLKERLLNEIMPVMTEVKDNILEKLTYSKVQDFDFLIRCFFESLRIEPPVPVSSNQCFSEDVTINGFTFRAGDAFWVCMGAI
jgi:cytochrome P450